MSRFRRLFIVVTWLTILAMVPLPWQQLGRLQLVFPTVAWASPNLMTPLASLLAGTTSASPALQNAFPPEQVVLQHPGGLAVGQKPPVRPEFDFSASPRKGPGVTVRVAAPADPVREVDLHLLGVGGRQGRQQGQPGQPGGKVTFDVPASGAVSQVIDEPVVGGPVGSFFSALLAAPGTPAATPSATVAPTRQANVTTTTTTTTTTAATSTRTSTTATAVTTTSTSATSPVTATATTGTATASLTPTPSGTPSVVPTPDTSAPGGNRYGAHLELTYAPTANGQGIKETLRLHDRPRTNVLSYQLEAPDFSAVPRPNGSYWRRY